MWGAEERKKEGTLVRNGGQTNKEARRRRNQELGMEWKKEIAPKRALPIPQQGKKRRGTHVDRHRAHPLKRGAMLLLPGLFPLETLSLLYLILFSIKRKLSPLLSALVLLLACYARGPFLNVVIVAGRMQRCSRHLGTH